jgi:ACR3 family arsenite efflux pump ArsB
MNRITLAIITPVIVGPLTFLVMQAMKRLSSYVDTLSPTTKRIAVMLIATTMTMLGSMTGVSVQCDPDAAVSCLETLDKDAIKAVVASALAFAMHAMKPKKQEPS